MVWSSNVCSCDNSGQVGCLTFYIQLGEMYVLLRKWMKGYIQSVATVSLRKKDCKSTQPVI